MMNRIFRPGGLALTETAAKAASLSTDTPILDIGCGTGSSLKHLHQDQIQRNLNPIYGYLNNTR